MTVASMVRREIGHRMSGFLLCVAVGVLAAGVLVGSLVRFAVHDAREEEMLRRKEAETREKMEALKADVKSAMHRLGYNAVILPKDQPLDDWYAEDYASKTMPASLAARVGEVAGLAERYLPRLRSKLKWNEQKRTVILVGVGEERILETTMSNPEPLVEPLSRGCCRLGYELHGGKIKPGEEIMIQGRVFRVVRCDEELGTKEDITIWMSLADAQELLGLEDRINEILIVEHHEVWGNLAEVRRRLAAVLPECQVVEIASQTLARLQAGRAAAEEAQASVQREREKQAALRIDRRRMAFLIGLSSFFVCTLWVGMFMFLNVRDRVGEMAILSALGFSSQQLRKLVLGKALLMGFTAGVLGAILGLATGLRGAEVALPVKTIVGHAALAVGVTVGASLIGSWIPARTVVRLDPALILGGE